MPLQSRFMPIESSYFPWDDMTNVWQPLNVFGLDFPCSIIKIFNTSPDYNLELSFDGINFHDYIPSIHHIYGTSCLEINATVNNPDLVSPYFRQGLIIYGRTPDFLFFNDGFVIIEGYTPFKE